MLNTNESTQGKIAGRKHKLHNTYIYGTPEGTFLFQYLPEKKMKKKKKRIGKEIKTITSRLNDLSSFLSNIEQNRNQNKKIRTEI